jgi:hypothetical protein
VSAPLMRVELRLVTSIPIEERKSIALNLLRPSVSPKPALMKARSSLCV